MDLDLTEYDQVDEIKMLLENQGQMYCDGSSSKFLVTLSSCSDQASLEEANCENDFVFLPAPPNLNYSNQQYSSATPSRSQSHLQSRLSTKSDDSSSLSHIQQVTQPLIQLNNNGGNPFGACQSGLESPVQKQPSSIMKHIEACVNKPIGLLEANPVNNNPSKLTELMQQIVTRSDSIYIAVPCAYCHEPVTCPPSDISSWVDHMSSQHNCKICPVCNKLVGLGPKRDLDIMRSHVIQHFDEEWLNRRSMRVNFSYGLQQHWFSSTRCGIKDPRSK